MMEVVFGIDGIIIFGFSGWVAIVGSGKHNLGWGWEGVGAVRMLGRAVSEEESGVGGA